MIEHRQVRKIAFGYVPETCPTLDNLMDGVIDSLIDRFGERHAEWITETLDEAREKIKADCTIPLREGLISAVADYEERLSH